MPRSSRLDARPPCDPPATARHERAGGGQVSGVLHYLMGRGIERKRLFIDKRDRQDFNTCLLALAFEKLCTFRTSLKVVIWAIGFSRIQYQTPNLQCQV